MPKQEPVLCYVSHPFAYFTTQPVENQWGDDWDDAPYEHNAGSPYEPCWHNLPKHRNDPEAKRGWREGTQIPMEAGELCRCRSCVRDWNEDGTPKYIISKLAFDGPYATPDSGYCNSPYSVQQINRKHAPWLRPDYPSDVNTEPIFGGDTMEEFIRKIEASGGTVYLPKSK